MRKVKKYLASTLSDTIRQKDFIALGTYDSKDIDLTYDCIFFNFMASIPKESPYVHVTLSFIIFIYYSRSFHGSF